MTTIATFLRHLFSVPPTNRRTSRRPGGRASTCLNVSLHDALSLNELALLHEDAYDDIGPWLADQPLEIRGYDSQQSLREQCSRTDHSGTDGMTMVVVLSEPFRGDLKSLVRRTHRAGRLILVSTQGWLSATTSPGDLALAASRLGWESIERQFTARDAVASASRSLAPGGKLVVVLPRRARRPQPLM
jgi:hypothetical protein